MSQVERLDPEDKQQIETVQARLRALENNEWMLSTDLKAPQRTYHELTEQLNALADKLAKQRL